MVGSVKVATNGYTNGDSNVNGNGHCNGSGSNRIPLKRNEAGGWIIQKFGGTSVGKFPVVIAEDIVRLHLDDHQVAIVCSARSTDTKAEGTTNRLLRAAGEAMSPTSQLYIDIINAVQEDHIRAANDSINSPELIEELVKDIETECAKLSSFLRAAQIIGEISPKSKDIIIGAGEKLSCLFMTALLKDRGVDAEYVNLEDIVPSKYPVKGGLGQDFYDFLAKALGERLRACDNRIPVVTGYFGVVPGSILTSIGRGYTDLCAALIAVGLGADELQIWKEVDGIFTADPRKVANARLIPAITPEEAAELTYYGSEVIHPFTMEQVIRARVPIRIKNVKNPAGSGTVILPNTMHKKEEETPTYPQKHFRLASEDSTLQHRSKRPTALTIKNSIVVLNIHSNRKSLSHGFFAKIFSALDKYQLVVDLISTSEVHISMALNSDAREHGLREAIEELRKYGTVDLIPDLCILSVVGKQMKHMIGIAGRMFSTLAESNINIEMISQGASEINISCVIKRGDAIRAMNVFHTHFFPFN